MRYIIALMRIALVVNDNYIYGDYYKILLERMGFSVVTAGDGEAVLQLTDKNSAICLVILDSRISRIEDSELISRIKKALPDVKVLVSAVFADEEAAGRLMALGADAVLRKPFPIEGFREAVRGLLES